MSSNSFGTIFRVTTWGESHGKAIGVVIDGCPAGLALEEDDIQKELDLRRPGRSPFTSPRREEDRIEILSGVFQGKTLGSPISLVIFSTDVQSESYEKSRMFYRPGHAEYTYAEKYGIYDHRGGGRSSGRETACRVAAGAVAKKLLNEVGIEVHAFLQQVGGVSSSLEDFFSLSSPREAVYNSPIYHPFAETEKEMVALLQQVKEEGDSIGGGVGFAILGAPTGLGDPVYEKIEANLGKAMMSIPASKGFYIGNEADIALQKGSQYNDTFTMDKGAIVPKTNRAGGLLGGISTGKPIVGCVVFKPTSSIQKPQESVTIEGEKAQLTLPKEGRHDPCVAIRAVPVVEAMARLVMVDAWLRQKNCHL